MNNSNSDYYEGHFVNDKRSGKGMFKWENGVIYEGEYFEDLRHGFGVIRWVDGSYFKGFIFIFLVSFLYISFFFL
jgi:hypothetical protein